MLHGPGRPHPLSASFTFLWQLCSTKVASHHIKQNYPRGASAPDCTYTFTLYYDLIPARTDITCFYRFLRNGWVSDDSVSSYPVSRKGKDLAQYHDVLRTGIIKMYLRHSFSAWTGLSSEEKAQATALTLILLSLKTQLTGDRGDHLVPRSTV